MANETQSELHNRIAPEIVKSIVRPPLDAGGQMTDVLIVLESVIVGVCLVAIKLGGDEIVLDTVVDRARERLAKERLQNIKPEGSA